MSNNKRGATATMNPVDNDAIMRVYATQTLKKRRTSVDVDPSLMLAQTKMMEPTANYYKPQAVQVQLPVVVAKELSPAYLEKLAAFQKMCDRHIGFLTSSIVVDKYLLSMVLIYFERARMKLIGYTKDRYFFYALFLAMEMEEDTLDGLTEIIHYILGQAPCTLNYGDNRAEQIRDQRLWDQRLAQFYQGKDAFWSRLGYQAYIRFDDIVATSERFPPHKVLSRTRTHKELATFSTY
eukprot:TRINITY_DN653_c0_g1_i1.p2 TRINITY_DN653_c0_g1~~TRINITY_DN653_c0_g1_i1.p2  ORF type:complete len:237 (+),score=44.04 TRINITY_DN653_c0_g1_i1:179-889(+)